MHLCVRVILYIQMKVFKKILRALGLLLLILMALSGIGIGAIFNTRERYQDKEIKIEMVDKERSENETQLGDQIQVKGWV